ncbi:PREDICTED: uncharacterized protein LOC104813956 isoform X2 [Tarenaya hassleriana]|uniref:uncharacterized protein LOC104813956 isoform X2 n=1 Tax=Tarenaya hassleriana TaxID=28532 RepID=UPI00053C71D1|nr:PREDICTED: uncharacterized protein LOC104813956 isoform X2 [Tarenaya hassleriana]
MAGSSLPSSLLGQGSSLLFSSLNQYCSRPKPNLLFKSGERRLVRCFAKKKISFVDQILDYIEGGPKLRKWYGAPDILPKDGSLTEEDQENEEEEEEVDDDDGGRDAVFVTDGDSDLGQMIILQLIVKRTRVKALVKDKRKAVEAFGTYVESMSGDANDKSFLRKALKGVRAIISPSLSVYGSSDGIQALVKNNARKLAEQDETAVMSSAVPYTIIRTGKLENSPGGKQGFNFKTGAAANGSLSKEDAACICVEALSVVPPKGLIFEVTNGDEVVSDWEGRLIKLMETRSAE